MCTTDAHTGGHASYLIVVVIPLAPAMFVLSCRRSARRFLQPPEICLLIRPDRPFQRTGSRVAIVGVRARVVVETHRFHGTNGPTIITRGQQRRRRCSGARTFWLTAHRRVSCVFARTRNEPPRTASTRSTMGIRDRATAASIRRPPAKVVPAPLAAETANRTARAFEIRERYRPPQRYRGTSAPAEFAASPVRMRVLFTELAPMARRMRGRRRIRFVRAANSNISISRYNPTWRTLTARAVALKCNKYVETTRSYLSQLRDSRSSKKTQSRDTITMQMPIVSAGGRSLTSATSQYHARNLSFCRLVYT